MTQNEIIALIDKCPDALTVIGDLSGNLAYELKKLTGLGHAGLDDSVKRMMAGHIVDAAEWSTDRSTRGNAAGEKILPSQQRLDVIAELQYFSSFFAAAKGEMRLRSREVLTKYAVDCLKKDGVLGLALLSRARFTELDTEFDRERNDLGLGGKSETLIDPNSVFGFDDPSIFTRRDDINIRLLPRKLARASQDGGSGFLRADPVTWGLTPDLSNALASARRDLDQDVDLKLLQDLLDNNGRQNLAECCRQAARLLEINFHMADGSAGEAPVNSTISSFLASAPLHRLIVKMFELLVPTHEVDRFHQIEFYSLEDVIIAKYESGYQDEEIVSVEVLSDLARELALSAILSAIDIVKYLNLKLDLYADAGLLRITEDVMKRQKDKMPDSLDQHQNAENHEERLDVGGERMIARIWAVRYAWLTLRGYANFFGWYGGRLLSKAESTEEIELAGAFNREICASIEYWADELGSRFQLGLAYEHDLTRRADDKPLSIPETPRAIYDRKMKLAEYYEGAEFGAIPDPVVVEAMITAISKDHPNVPGIWSAASAFVNPFARVAKS